MDKDPVYHLPSEPFDDVQPSFDDKLQSIDLNTVQCHLVHTGDSCHLFHVAILSEN